MKYDFHKPHTTEQLLKIVRVNRKIMRIMEFFFGWKVTIENPSKFLNTLYSDLELHAWNAWLDVPTEYKLLNRG